MFDTLEEKVIFFKVGSTGNPGTYYCLNFFLSQLLELTQYYKYENYLKPPYTQIETMLKDVQYTKYDTKLEWCRKTQQELYEFDLIAKHATQLVTLLKPDTLYFSKKNPLSTYEDINLKMRKQYVDLSTLVNNPDVVRISFADMKTVLFELFRGLSKHEMNWNKLYDGSIAFTDFHLKRRDGIRLFLNNMKSYRHYISGTSNLERYIQYGIERADWTWCELDSYVYNTNSEHLVSVIAYMGYFHPLLMASDNFQFLTPELLSKLESYRMQLHEMCKTVETNQALHDFRQEMNEMEPKKQEEKREETEKEVKDVEKEKDVDYHIRPWPESKWTDPPPGWIGLTSNKRVRGLDDDDDPPSKKQNTNKLARRYKKKKKMKRCQKNLRRSKRRCKNHVCKRSSKYCYQHAK